MCSQLSSDHSHDCGRQSFKVVKSIWGPGHGGAHLRSHNSESRANRLRVPSSSASLKPTWATWDPPNVNKQNRSKIVQCQCWEPEFNYTGLRLIFPKQYSGIHTYTVTSTHTWWHPHTQRQMKDTLAITKDLISGERWLQRWSADLISTRIWIWPPAPK